MKRRLILALLVTSLTDLNVFGDNVTNTNRFDVRYKNIDNGIELNFTANYWNQLFHIEYSMTPYYHDTLFGGGIVSKNMIGYVRLNLKKGYSLIGNQLNRGNNKIAEVLNEVPDGTIVYKYDGNYISNSYVDGVWEDSEMVLSVGEGFFIYSPIETTITMLGEVSNNNVKALVSGYNLLTMPLAIDGDLLKDGKFIPNDGDAIYRWDGERFSVNEYVDGVWYPSTPKIKVGEAFFLHTNSVRNYELNNSVDIKNNWISAFVASTSVGGWDNPDFNWDDWLLIKVPIAIEDTIGIAPYRMNRNVGFFRLVSLGF